MSRAIRPNLPLLGVMATCNPKTGSGRGCGVRSRPLSFPQELWRGFTLIELMIVVTIIGILAAIAIPQFAEYRKKAFNATALHDLHNIMVGEEAEYASTQAYTAVAAGVGPAWILGNTKFVSKGVGYVVNIANSGNDYAVFTGHQKGTREFGGDRTGAIMYKVVADPASSAKTETVGILSGWGGTPL